VNIASNLQSSGSSASFISKNPAIKHEPDAELQGNETCTAFLYNSVSQCAQTHLPTPPPAEHPLEKLVTRRIKTAVDVLTKRRFCSLWDRHEIPDDASDPACIWANLLDRFAEPHRRYHGKTHMEHCLQEFDQASSSMENPDAVEMALWFHDVVYAAGANDNEEKSVALFERFARHTLEEAFADEVSALILDTKHIQLPVTSNAKYTVDIDLASFGRPWPEFMADCHALRNEQTTLSHEQYYRKKYAFLNSLLARQNIYSTPHFQERYESAARQNMARYIELIQT
jgi:predicted metal-dependent HD superfamily phosphohydrolase